MGKATEEKKSATKKSATKSKAPKGEAKTKTAAKASATKKAEAAKPDSKKSAAKAAKEKTAPATAKQKAKPVEPPAQPVKAVDEAQPVSLVEEERKAESVPPAPIEAEPPAVEPRSEAETVKAPQPSAERPASEIDDTLLPTNRGKVAIFGGPKDRAIKPDDKVALPIGRHFTFERVRSLDARSFYCSMRWNYHVERKSPEEGKRWWANKKLFVSNPANGRAVIVRAVDYGPHENTGFDIGLSPGAASALGVGAGDEVEIFFADQKLPLGVFKKE